MAGGARAKDFLFRWATRAHRAMLVASGGRLLGRLGGMPVVVLTTTGRRSGRARRTVLTAPIAEPDRVVLVASYGGDARHPHWYRNLRAHPEVTVSLGGRARRMRAHVASADEHARLWPRVVSTYAGYARYQASTTRRIPLVVLEPEDHPDSTAPARRQRRGARRPVRDSRA